MVPVLLMVVQLAVPAATWAVNTMVTVPLAGTVMLEMLTKPSALVPPVLVEELVMVVVLPVTVTDVAVKPLMLAGTLSVTLTLLAATPAVSVRVMVYCSVSPGLASPPLVTATSLVEVLRSGCTRVPPALETVSVLLLLPLTLSKLVVATVAVFARLIPALVAIATVRVMGLKLLPEATVAVLVQVTACPTAVQGFQPVPVPETKVSPAGRVSVTVVVVPDVFAGPLLVTVRV